MFVTHHQRQRLRFAGRTASLATLAIASVSAAHAADTPSAPVALAAADSFEEILVTATKRQESVQDVPLSITAVTGNDLANREIRVANDIVRLIPNASAATTEGRARPRWFIRGVGSNDPASNVVNPIGVYFDEVYLNSPHFQAFPIFDLERVEVLRGPQGTLWGKNTVGGAIHYVSKKPRFEPEGTVRLGIGNDGSRSAQAGFGGAIIDDVLAARASIFIERRDGLFYNQVTGSRDGTGDFADWAGRFQLLAKPSENFDLLLSLRYRNLDGSSQPRVFEPAYPETQNPPSLRGQPAPTDDYGNVPPRDRDIVGLNAAGSNAIEQQGVTLTANWYAGDYTLTSITAYDDGTLRNSSDSDFTPFEGSRTYSNVGSEQFTQELRLTSPRDDRFNWILGAHYFWEDFNSDSASGTLYTSAYNDRLSGAPRWRHAYYQDVLYSQETKSWAAFGSATFNVTDALSLTAGLRYTSEKRSATIDIFNGAGEPATRRLATTNPAAVPTADRPLFTFLNPGEWWRRSSVATTSPVAGFVSSPEKTWNRFTWDITPQYKISDDVLFYLKHARGFRSGTFQASANQATQFDPEGIAPEDLYSYEAGLKTSWFGGRLTANLAGFYYDYKKIQALVQGVPVVTAGTTSFAARLINAKGWSKGIELDIGAAVTDNFTLNGSIGLLDTKYTEDFIPNNPNTGLLFGKGNEFTRAPHVTANVAADYRLPLSWGEIFLGTDWSYRTAQYFTVNAQETDPSRVDYLVSQYQRQKAYALGNARIGVAFDDGRFEIQAWARNLTDKNYKILTFGTQQGARLTTLGEPRTYGLSATARF